MQEFLELFKFEPEKSMLTGIERECFLTNGQGKIAPIAHQTLQHLKKDNSEQFGFELSACQLEDRVGPCKLSNLKKELITNDWTNYKFVIFYHILRSKFLFFIFSK